MTGANLRVWSNAQLTKCSLHNYWSYR